MSDDGKAPLEGLAGLAREAPPPPGVEERVVAALHRQGLLRRPRAWRVPLAVAASLALFAAGIATGRWVPRAPSAPSEPSAPSLAARPQFLLLLYRGADAARLPDSEEAARVREYSAWARGLHQAGALVAGEKLEDETRSIGGAPPSEPVQGYFLIAADDLASAERTARACPHVAHGGVVVVRPIANTRSRS